MSHFDYNCPNCFHKYLVGGGVYVCPKCGQENNVEQDSIPVTEKPETDSTGDSIETRLEEYFHEKYPALRTITGFYKFLAYGVGVVAIISFIVGFVTIIDSATDFYDPKLGAILMLGSVVVGSITVITLLATSEGIMLFVNMANDLSEVKMSLDDQ